MATGENFTRISSQRSDALRKMKDETIDEALNMQTNNKHILALRKELDYYKRLAKNWEQSANESGEDIDSILKVAKAKNIPELLDILNKI